MWARRPDNGPFAVFPLLGEGERVSGSEARVSLVVRSFHSLAVWTVPDPGSGPPDAGPLVVVALRSGAGKALLQCQAKQKPVRAR